MDTNHTQGECENYMMIKGHRNAVTDLHWTTDGQTIIASGADNTIRAFDAVTSKQIKKMGEHTSFVNACCPARRGPQLIVSGSDDGTAKLWDIRVKGCIQTFAEDYQVRASLGSRYPITGPPIITAPPRFSYLPVL